MAQMRFAEDWNGVAQAHSPMLVWMKRSAVPWALGAWGLMRLCCNATRT
jgi:hypothetical protein